MIRKGVPSLIAVLLTVLVIGCAAKVETSLSTEFNVIPIRDVAVLQVVWPEGRTETPAEPEIASLFRAMTVERLETLNYGVVPLDVVDERIAGFGEAEILPAAPDEAARLAGADAVLYIRIERWDVDDLLTYTSLEMEATFELYSGTGLMLWQASYSTSEADLGLDEETIRLAVVDTYEPRVQRFVDAVMATLPRSSHVSPPRRFFDWLP
jgi:hypothetical protein